MPLYDIAGGSRRTQLLVSQVQHEPFWVETQAGQRIPLLILSISDLLGRPASTGNRLVHAEAELLTALASPDVVTAWPGHHSLELTFDKDDHLIGLSGQV